jgi:hypothetical protein
MVGFAQNPLSWGADRFAKPRLGAFGDMATNSVSPEKLPIGKGSDAQQTARVNSRQPPMS